MKKNITRRIVIGLATALGALALAACDPQAIKELEEGVSTEADVVARFAGTPPEPDSGEYAITTALRRSLRDGTVWSVGLFRGTYVNVNGADDLARAEREIPS